MNHNKRDDIEYLLKCPICNKKMWFHNAAQHRYTTHSEITEKEFEVIIIKSLKDGKIKPKTFDNEKIYSATDVINKERKKNKRGIKSLVSGGNF